MTDATPKPTGLEAAQDGEAIARSILARAFEQAREAGQRAAIPKNIQDAWSKVRSHIIHDGGMDDYRFDLEDFFNGSVEAAHSVVPSEGMRVALKPFAEVADLYDDQEDDDFEVWQDVGRIGVPHRYFELRYYRKARAALRTDPETAKDIVAEKGEDR